MAQRTFLPNVVRTAVVLVLSTALLSAIAVHPVSASASGTKVHEMTEIANSWGDLNSGADEWSGATYNADNHSMFLVDDETGAYEIFLNEDGSIDEAVPVRVLTIALGVSDWEGVAWMEGQKYALISEESGYAYVVDIPTNSNIIGFAHLVSSFEAGGPDGNTGAEGISVGSDGSFYVTDEKPSSVSKYTGDGEFVAEVLLPELSDASGVVAAIDDTLVVISDESAKAIHYSIDFEAETRTVLATIDLGLFNQVEGVALIGNEQLHFWGELKAGGQTYAQYEGHVIPPEEKKPVKKSDVNCSGDMDIADALVIAKSVVGTAEIGPDCGDGDVNADDKTDVADALIIAKCEAGLPSEFCES